MVSPLASLLDFFADEDSVDVIDAGTLRTTRGTAVFLISFLTIFYLIDGFGPEITWLNDSNKYLFVLGAGFIWAIVAASDAIARGMATGRKEAAVVAAGSSYALASTLACKRTEGTDDPGWKAVAVRKATDDNGPEFLVFKGDKVAWVKATDLSFG